MAVSSGREICLLDPVAAAERDRRMRLAASTGLLPRTTFQGMPPLRGGLFSPTPGAGELFLQPTVSRRDRPDELFDDAFGPQVLVAAHHFAVPDLLATAAKLGVPVLAVADPSTGAAENLECDGLIHDQQVSEWFTRHGVAVAVLRPDRYVYGTATSADEAQTLLAEAVAYFPASR